jgi:hypothetical protein
MRLMAREEIVMREIALVFSAATSMLLAGVPA